MTYGFIRQRLLERRTLDLKTMFDQARSLECTVHSSESYTAPLPSTIADIPPAGESPSLSTDPETLAATSGLQEPKCFFCQNKIHCHFKCPACDATCSNCQKKRDFQKVCGGNPPMLSPKVTSAALCNPTIVIVSAAVVPPSLSKLTTIVRINGFETKALIDS